MVPWSGSQTVHPSHLATRASPQYGDSVLVKELWIRESYLWALTYHERVGSLAIES